MAKPKVTERSIYDYVPDDHNANEGTERGLQMVEESLREDGVGRSIVADKNDKIPAGNKTLEAAVNAGITKVIEIETDGDALLVHKRTDWDLDDAQGAARRYAYRDNRASEVGLAWDANVIAADVAAGMDLSHLFTQPELEYIGIEFPSELAPDVGAQVDRADELLQVWQVERGQLWVIPSKTGKGEHRLLCGDSTNADDVARVMGDTDKPTLMVTDPPYGVEYDAHWREEYDQYERHSVGAVTNDDRDNWTEAYKLFTGDVAYIWHASLRCVPVGLNLIEAGFELRYQIIWNKQHFVFSRGHYHWKHEPCWYVVRIGKQADWIGTRDQSTVWDIANHNPMGGEGVAEKTTHSTEKPLECMARPIRNHDALIVYDPFGGSGTTMAACEQLSRQCRMIEIEPKYCAVILQRLADMGLTPRLVESNHIGSNQ